MTAWFRSASVVGKICPLGVRPLLRISPVLFVRYADARNLVTSKLRRKFVVAQSIQTQANLRDRQLKPKSEGIAGG
jgi:hypothetical protein